MTTLLGSKMKTLRQHKGLTLEQLGQHVGVGKSYIWEVENRGMSPTAEKLALIAQSLDVTVDYLVDKRQSEPGDDVERKVFLRKFDTLDKEDQRRIMDVVDTWSKKKT